MTEEIREQCKVILKLALYLAEGNLECLYIANFLVRLLPLNSAEISGPSNWMQIASFQGVPLLPGTSAFDSEGMRLPSDETACFGAHFIEDPREYQIRRHLAGKHLDEKKRQAKAD